MEDKRELLDNEQAPISTKVDPPPAYQAAPSAPPPQNYTYADHNGQYQYQQQQNVGQQHPGGPPTVFMIRNPQTPPKDYMTMAILVTIFCCLPFGIVGIVKSSSARTMYAVGNFQAAEMTSQSAGTWTKAGLICGILFWVFYTIFMIVYIVVVLEAVDWDD